jgi:hypothetical protein
VRRARRAPASVIVARRSILVGGVGQKGV